MSSEVRSRGTFSSASGRPHCSGFWRINTIASGDRPHQTTAELRVSSGQGRDRTADLPLFRRTLIPTELPGRKAACASLLATLTGLEPATSDVTGRRDNQLRHRASLLLRVIASQVPPTGFEPALPP